MARADFDAMWVPRMGSDAAAQLKRVGVRVLWNLFDLPLAIVASIGFGSGKPVGVVLGLVSVALAVVLFGLLNREHRRLARDLSEWYGVKIHWWEMPRFNEKLYDAWCVRRGLHHAG
jgi:hypothetical protein